MYVCVEPRIPVCSAVVSSESVCACPRVIQVMVEKEQGSFGFTVRGGASQEEPARSRPLTITHVRPGGPTDRSVRRITAPSVCPVLRVTGCSYMQCIVHTIRPGPHLSVLRCHAFFNVGINWD